MFAQVISVAVLVVAGVMLADALAHPTGTKTLIDGVTGLWTTSLRGVAGQAVS